jgi:hypothetical protein
MIAVPKRLASRAGMADWKKVQTCAPLPEREISTAAVMPSSAHEDL